ncbi:amidohydrolase [Brevibacillus sp. B_LB10_24]|uniref:amidohydrolase n=1 Tax=Brevibacillus sp. B_LB10_24 TaxID=3380645 RepID=UPI0038B9301F
MEISKESLAELAQQIKDDLIGWRRYLHKHPELSFQEKHTSQFICDTLQTFDGLELSRPTETSVMAKLKGPRPGKTLAIRADIDALPIHEENDCDFVSENPGVMHACGHDGHTAILLGTAKILSSLKDQLQGEIRFLFQHAEEQAPGGAQQMVDAGVMEGVDRVIGLHLHSPLEVGNLNIKAGPTHAASDEFSITVIGVGGHAAQPHDAIDSLAIAAQVVTNLQHIVSRNTDPLENLVLSVTKIMGGSAFNVIPGSVELAGTVRSFNPEVRKHVPGMMERVVKGITEAHGGTYEFSYKHGHDPVINDQATAELVKETLIEAFGQEAVQPMIPTMGGEDFSAFQAKAPGTYFWVGAGNVSKGIVHPHHHPRFAIDEDSLVIGVQAFLHLAFKLVK